MRVCLKFTHLLGWTIARYYSGGSVLHLICINLFLFLTLFVITKTLFTDKQKNKPKLILEIQEFI